VIATILFVGCGLSLPASGGAYVYWANYGSASGTTIGRAALDGSGVSQELVSGLNAPCGVAASGTYLYWSNQGTDSIGRAKIDGSQVEPDFIEGAADPCGVAVGAPYIYWANQKFGEATIGRANLDGSSPKQDFVSGLANVPCDVAVNGSHIFWSTYLTNSIGRANLNGALPEYEFIKELGGPCGVAVNASNIYWANQKTSSIGRAPLSGTSSETEFVNGAEGGCGVAVDGAHIYWADIFGGGVGRANLDGSGADPDFISSGPSTACGVAADPFPAPSTTTIACVPDPTTALVSTSCTARVAGTASEPAPPTGAVDLGASGVSGTFTPGSFCALADGVGGQSTCQLNYTPAAAGALTLTATYDGDVTHASSTGSLGVDVLAPSNKFGFGRFKANRRKGTGKLPVKVPGPGNLVLRGKGLKRVSKKAQAPGSVKLTVKPVGGTARKLEEREKLKVTAKVTFTPTAGTSRTKSRKLTLLG
jgi:hypothetical protein